jgi:outer membrane protein assembly factor BamB
MDKVLHSVTTRFFAGCETLPGIEGQEACATLGHRKLSPRRYLVIVFFFALMWRTGVAFCADPTLTNLWTTTVGNISDSSPAIAEDGTIYFGTFDGRLLALMPEGEIKWVFRADREIKSSPAVAADGTVYFGSRDRTFYALSPVGKQQWAFKTGAWVDSSAAIASDGSVHFGSWDGKMYSLSPTGQKLWEFDTGHPIVSSPAIGLDGTIYFGSHNNKFYALSSTGEKKWAFQTGGSIVSSPAIQGQDYVFFTSVDGFLYSLNLDGTLNWKLRTGGITESSPVLGDTGNIYTGVNKALWAVSREGKRFLEFGTHDLLESSATAFMDGTFCFISRYGLLLCLTPKRELAWAYYVYGQGYASPAVGRTGTIYLHTYNVQKDFSALMGSQPLASSSWPKFRGNARNTGNLADHMRL